ncbi:condensin complex subunit 3 [Leptopilina heterotoma]|uniref:condensin complex subunit 3 n=1 Tax=Leptopilina heterotoma TaxID=63436 RepID=UPI001CA95A3A|nr:condensin complex subunit 3 [Leptopilina heterotoma]
MHQSLRNCIRDLFNKAQTSKTCHKSVGEKLKACYAKTTLDEFAEEFIACLVVPLSYADKHPVVENSLIFAANFAVGFQSYEDVDNSEQMDPFMLKIFDFLMKSQIAVDPGVRFRVCYFLNMLLTAMGDDAYIDDILCDKIITTMLDRVLDRSSKVRAQAILALQRLQDPTDDDCRVMKVYMFHLAKDPSSEVRRTILSCMARTQRTLLCVLRRTRDINDLVRKAAYQFLCKVSVKSLSIKQREELLNDGLRDQSDIVKNCVKKELIDSWLRNYNGDFLALLRALDPGMNIKGMESAVLTLKSLLETSEIKTLLEQLPVEVQTRLIPLDKITCENVLFWRCVAEHLKREGCTEDLEEIVPELSQFCTFIRELLALIDSKQLESWEKTMYQFMLCQLFEMSKIYDLSDECGRENLRSIMVDTLMHEICSDKIVQCIVEYFDQVIPDVDRRLTALVEVINELRRPSKQTQTQQVCQLTSTQANDKNMLKAKLKVTLLELKEDQYNEIQNKNYLRAEELKVQIERITAEIHQITEELELPTVTEDVGEEPLKNDSHTMTICLEIMCSSMQSPSIKTLHPTLRSILDHIVIENLGHQDVSIHELELKSIVICCLLDGELAKKYFTMFFLPFTEFPDDYRMWITALKAIFDLLLRYGLEFFDIVQADDEIDANDKSKRNRTVRLYTESDEVSSVNVERFDIEQGGDKFIKIITGFLDHEDPSVRFTAAEGLTKLLFCRRINSPRLLARLIILWHNPLSEGNTYLTQCLCAFFNNFSVHVPDSQTMLEEAFLPTLKTLANAPERSPLQAIDPLKVCEIILSLTRQGVHKRSSVNVHNDLVFTILSEVLNPNCEIDPSVLIRSMKFLEVKMEIESLKENLKEALDNTIEKVQEIDKRLVKYIEQFKNKLNAIDAREAQDEDNVSEANSESSVDSSQ